MRIGRFLGPSWFKWGNISILVVIGIALIVFGNWAATDTVVSTDLVCKRIEPSQPTIICRRERVRANGVLEEERFELRGARIETTVRNNKTRHTVMLQTDRGEIRFYSGSDVSGFINADRVRKSINWFVQSPEEATPIDTKTIQINDGQLIYHSEGRAAVYFGYSCVVIGIVLLLFLGGVVLLKIWFKAQRH